MHDQDYLDKMQRAWNWASPFVFFSNHVGLYKNAFLLNTLSEFCSKWGLKVNMSKTEAMIFRNGGIIKQNEVLYFKDKKLENVSYYKYLGVTMSTRLSWSPAQVTLATHAGKALNIINQVTYKCDCSFKSSCNIFDKCVVPVLTYGSEVWGTAVHKSVESIHLKFCKNQLGVGSRTPTPAVLGECGRERLYVTCIIKCVKYWSKIISLPAESLLRSCYLVMCNRCHLGKTNWASKIRDILYSYGFGWIWENQHVPDSAAFMRLFSERVRDCELQLWSSDLYAMPKLKFYSKY